MTEATRPLPFFATPYRLAIIYGMGGPAVCPTKTCQELTEDETGLVLRGIRSKYIKRIHLDIPIRFKPHSTVLVEG